MDSRDAALSYIDNLVSSAQRAEDSRSRLIRLQVIVSTLLLLLAAGVVSTREDLSISGIELVLPLWTLIAGAAGAAATLQVFIAFQGYHGKQLNDEILTRYDELGYTTPRDNNDRGVGLFSSPIDVTTGIWGDQAYSAGFVRGTLALTAVIMALTILILLPAAAQIAAIVKLGNGPGRFACPSARRCC